MELTRLAASGANSDDKCWLATNPAVKLIDKPFLSANYASNQK